MPAVPKPTRKKREPRPERVKYKEACPLEETEQIKLAQWLDWNKVWWTHVPNGGYRHAVTANRLKAQGVKAGVQDALIFDRPPAFCASPGVAVELKRRDKSLSVLSVHQQQWKAELTKRGWLCGVFYGADEAIEWLKSIGFGKGNRA